MGGTEFDRAEGGGRMWGGGVPSSLGKGVERGLCPSTEKISTLDLK